MSLSLAVAGWLVRPDVAAVTAACVVPAVVATVAVLCGRGTGWLPLTIAAAVLLPLAYADAVTEGVAGRLAESLSQGRIARAERQAAVVAWLRPWAEAGGMPVTELVPRLAALRADLDRQVRRPLRGDEPLPVIGARIDALIQLERAAEALPLLEPLVAGGDPVALDYLGLCRQRLEEPAASLAAYRRAVAAWEAAPPGPRRTAGLVNGLKGVAYAARQLDRRADETRAYEAVVALDDAPRHLLLLARCHHDHGRTQAAADLLEQVLARTDEPAVRATATRLLVGMRRDHFGCLSVPRPADASNASTLPTTP
jgi:tetratricopeptide (TPR) repeat protein